MDMNEQGSEPDASERLRLLGEYEQALQAHRNAVDELELANVSLYYLKRGLALDDSPSTQPARPTRLGMSHRLRWFGRGAVVIYQALVGGLLYVAGLALLLLIGLIVIGVARIALTVHG